MATCFYFVGEVTFLVCAVTVEVCAIYIYGKIFVSDLVVMEKEEREGETDILLDRNVLRLLRWLHLCILVGRHRGRLRLLR